MDGFIQTGGVSRSLILTKNTFLKVKRVGFKVRLELEDILQLTGEFNTSRRRTTTEVVHAFICIYIYVYIFTVHQIL